MCEVHNLVHEATVLEVSTQDNILTGVEHNLDVLTVGSASDVVVNDAVLVLVDSNEFCEEVVDTELVVVGVSEVSGEVSESGLGLDVDLEDLLLEKIPLV